MPNNRTNKISVRLSDGEYARMKTKMAEAGYTSMSRYMRKMMLDGYIVNIDTSDIRKMVYLVRMCSNNLNQYAKKANAFGTVYKDDIKDIQQRLDDIWEGTRGIIRKFASIS